ncbi:MAG: EamA family transporter [Terriglobia bacterium]
MPTTTHRWRIPTWLVFSLLTILLWGVWGATSKAVADDITAYMNQVLFTLGLIPLMLLVLRSPRLSGGNNRKRGIFYAFITGILGGTGNIAFFKSLTMGGQASVVVPMTALSPLVTVLMALVILRERLSASQKVGLVLALAAIYLLSL